jgi:hypothetical protein
LNTDIQQRLVDGVSQAFLNHTGDVCDFRQVGDFTFGSHEISLQILSMNVL